MRYCFKAHQLDQFAMEVQQQLEELEAPEVWSSSAALLALNEQGKESWGLTVRKSLDGLDSSLSQRAFQAQTETRQEQPFPPLSAAVYQEYYDPPERAGRRSVAGAVDGAWSACWRLLQGGYRGYDQ